MGASTGFLDRCRFFGLQETSQLGNFLGAVAQGNDALSARALLTCLRPTRFCGYVVEVSDLTARLAVVTASAGEDLRDRAES